MVTQFLQSVFPYDEHREWGGDRKHLPFIHNREVRRVWGVVTCGEGGEGRELVLVLVDVLVLVLVLWLVLGLVLMIGRCCFYSFRTLRLGDGVGVGGATADI